MNIAITTIVSRNYISYARVLCESLKRHHPEVTVYTLVIDALTDEFKDKSEPFNVLTFMDLHTPEQIELLQSYEHKQIISSKKPTVIRHILGMGYDTVIYLDADILVLNSLDPLIENVSRHAMSVTPHLGKPEDGAGRFHRENELLLRGMFNAGFIGATGRDETSHFLDWWDARLTTHCEDRENAGIHYDQRWLDFAPAYIADLYINDDPGCNVAYWNIPDLVIKVGSTSDQLEVNKTCCRFFHFSGYDPRFPDQLSSHQPSLHVADFPALLPLFKYYSEQLMDCGFMDTITQSS